MTIVDANAAAGAPLPASAGAGLNLWACSRAARGKKSLTMTVLAGGPGVEREISLQSGQAVSEALNGLGHGVALCDVDPGDLSALDREAGFVFIALHGEFGEDGTVQAELEARGVPYSGSGPRASRIAMDKGTSKRLFDRMGIPTPRYEVVNRSTLRAWASTIPLPAVVKPVASGSSVDISIARARADLRDAVTRLVSRYGEALVERYVDGPELTVGIVGDHALPVCEIRTSREFYDYQAKYLDNDTQYLFDLDLPAVLLGRVQALSLAAHKALGCSVFSRVDWRVDGATLEPFVLEVNTIPGFTSHSLLPKAAAKAGLSFPALCRLIVELSLARHADKNPAPAASL